MHRVSVSSISPHLALHLSDSRPRQSHRDFLELRQGPPSRFHALRAEVVHLLIEVPEQDLPEAVHDLSQSRGGVRVRVGQRGLQESVILVQTYRSARTATGMADLP